MIPKITSYSPSTTFYCVTDLPYKKWAPIFRKFISDVRLNEVSMSGSNLGLGVHATTKEQAKDIVEDLWNMVQIARKSWAMTKAQKSVMSYLKNGFNIVWKGDEATALPKLPGKGVGANRIKVSTIHALRDLGLIHIKSIAMDHLHSAELVD